MKHKHADVLQAIAEGKAVQFKDGEFGLILKCQIP
ncbi:hypothetical protein vBAcoSR7M_8 [Alteromonas phage vB_AcoS-R7M]|uniref:Uncharacterized protein n=1 Tax=Alteromonas phage vB_AcoS-R7M TaxID=2729541 RepID=A0A6M3YND0_9CAUD|nr:hypothetical protein HWD34_gp08 [Alteromonas phage vB_AcoS-R7M]QJI53330.1 hypothetical protein vBAcoSR7M_8 [Alteromonas phage vB_AcoS-R7M]